MFVETKVIMETIYIFNRDYITDSEILQAIADCSAMSGVVEQLIKLFTCGTNLVGADNAWIHRTNPDHIRYIMRVNNNRIEIPIKPINYK